MKNCLFLLLFFIEAISINVASANEYAECMKETREDHRACLRDGTDPEKCSDTKIRNMKDCKFYADRADRRDKELERANRGETTGIGDFTPIPQRQPYVLPGMP